MLQKIIAFLLGQKTTASITSSFNKMVADLNEVEVRLAKEAADHLDAIQQSTLAHQAATLEASAARGMSARISNLLGDTIAQPESAPVSLSIVAAA